jgi:uncharacterized protein YwbE
LIAGTDQFTGKTVERGFVRRPLFQQRVARPQRLGVTLEQRQIGRVRLREQQIQETPPHPGRALDQLQVLRAKHHHSQYAEVIGQLPDGPVVEDTARLLPWDHRL